jgi:hypothetical protein
VQAEGLTALIQPGDPAEGHELDAPGARARSIQHLATGWPRHYASIRCVITGRLDAGAASWTRVPRKPDAVHHQIMRRGLPRATSDAPQTTFWNSLRNIEDLHPTITRFRDLVAGPHQGIAFAPPYCLEPGAVHTKALYKVIDNGGSPVFG